MIVVLDTNVWLSAFLSPRGFSGRVLTLVRMGVVQPVSSPKLWAELTRAAEYDRVRMPLQRRGVWEDARRFLASHPRVTLVASVEPTTNWMPEDPDDNWVIQCAVSARADRIVSGDKPLLELEAVADVRIVSPRELVDEVGVEFDD
jgi:putative PIN family toxin of toxin-antitoxin system